MHEAGQQPQDQEPRNRRQPRPPSIWTGLNWTIALHLIFQIPLAFVLSGGAFRYIGVSQLLYLIPAIVWVAVKKKEPEFAKGLAIGAGITFLLNASCLGIVLAIFGV